MKANELRLGNLVLFNNETVEIKTYDFKYPETFKPITLTEECLVKFGFEKSKYKNVFNGYDFIIKTNCCWMSYTSSDFSLSIADKKSGLDSSDMLNPIHNAIINVHQLQNLYFALTGEELTIKE
tara:strand:- start:917 stop:1288 length:372 start_codon:yes stop_codon:yes gene_type:complete